MEEIKQETISCSTTPNAAKSLTADYPCCIQTDFICLSHIRWDFVYQRPQHLLSRFAKYRRVFYIEEPIFEDIDAPRMDISKRFDHLYVAVPKIPKASDQKNHSLISLIRKNLLDDMIQTFRLERFTLWYYTPMALSFTRHLNPDRVIYDCMDELSGFKDAHESLVDFENELISLADHVFTSGQSLFEAKKHKHPSTHSFPSSIDYSHFSQARLDLPDPDDQSDIPHPRIGFFGVIDERMDLDLIRQSAEEKAEWNFIFLGPIAKISPDDLLELPNIHYLGMKSYQDLPLYLAHWDLAMLPFAINEATKFSSPTKTPEYLAAGKPVISTPLQDVVHPYGEHGLVHIAKNAEEFIHKIEIALREKSKDVNWLKKVDHFLSEHSWDSTWQAMADLERSIAHAWNWHRSHAKGNAFIRSDTEIPFQ